MLTVGKPDHQSRTEAAHGSVKERKGAFMLLCSSKSIFPMGVTEEEVHAFIQTIIAVKQSRRKSFPLCTESSEAVTSTYFPRLTSLVAFLFPTVSNAFILSLKLI